MAKKDKIQYVCNQCGAEFLRWQGQCNACGDWNSITEVRAPKGAENPIQARYSGYAGALQNKVQLLNEIDLEETPRFSSSFKELDRVLGGGIVPGGAVLIGGNPGAGKSTLLLQVMCRLSQHYDTLYITGEESLQQVAMRAKRLGLPMDKLQLLSETSIEQICAVADEYKPQLIVIDSIQVMHVADVSSAPGSISQVRESAATLTRYAKQHNVAVFMVGHVTKEGALAGPKVLEHCIDCSIMLEGDSNNRYRTLRSQKNRFGAVNELGVFAMTETGMKEVSNPSAIFLTRSEANTSGSSVLAIWEGTRALLVEIQALVDCSQQANPRRIAVGVDLNRVVLLLAILHKHGGVHLGDQDVFVNVAGGVKIAETGSDLALLFSLLSSFRERALPVDLVIFGEVGLSGEVRPVPNGQERLSEAAKHGFKQAIVPIANMPKKSIAGMHVIGIKNVQQALEVLADLTTAHC